MNYKVKTIPKFEKNLKRLVKKYPSLKGEYQELVNELKKNPNLGMLATTVIKYYWQLVPKGKGKLVEQG